MGYYVFFPLYVDNDGTFKNATYFGSVTNVSNPTNFGSITSSINAVVWSH